MCREIQAEETNLEAEEEYEDEEEAMELTYYEWAERDGKPWISCQQKLCKGIFYCKWCFFVHLQGIIFLRSMKQMVW